MTEPTQTSASATAAGPAAGQSGPRASLLPVICLLFIGSGAAALIYEIVWLQLLQLVIGSSSVSLGVLLGTFMGGMCLGSILLPKYVSTRHHPLRVYAALEIGIGIIGLLLLVFMPLVGSLYTAWGGYGFFGFLLRGLVASICLLPPTLLMGATLPAVARWVETTPSGVSWLGFFYGGNIAGAVMGCLLAGFYLLRVYDMSIATYVAFGINVVVAGLAYGAARVTPYAAGDTTSDETPAVANVPAPRPVEGATIAYVAIGLSGLCALAAEVIWTRTLGLLFGATVYTFSIILAVFLVGLGIGSTVGASLAKSSRNPRALFGWCQILAAAAIAWGAVIMSESLPYWPINPSISTDIWYNFQLDLVRGFWPMLPGALLWGASFPLALATIASKGQDPGRLVGGVYAANTLGAVIGALSGSLILVATIGSQRAQQVLIVVSAISGLLLLTQALDGPASARVRGLKFAGLLVVAAVAGLLIRSVPPISSLLVAYGRYSATWVDQSEIIYTGEGVNSSVAVSRVGSGVLNYHNAGKIQASSEPQDMRLQRMLGHLTTLMPPNPKSVVVIGCGAGVTAGAVSIDPRLDKVTIVEIEPLVPEVVSTYFSEHNFDVVNNPKVEIQIDDARHFILTTDQKFDAITSDPLDPWVKGAATLYTKEFFEAVRERLNPGGVVTLFVQLYESTPQAVKSEIGTFLEVFPNGVIFGNAYQGQGYDTVLYGQVEPLQIDVDAKTELLTDPMMAPVANSLAEVGIYSAVDLFANYAGRKQDLGDYLADAQINRDRNLKLQYLAGLGLNLYEAGSIYDDILSYRQFPEDIFIGSSERIQALRAAMQRTYF